jgi:hypothetical protein
MRRDKAEGINVSAKIEGHYESTGTNTKNMKD